MSIALTQKPTPPSGPGQIDVYAALALMATPEKMRNLLLEAREAEKAARSAIDELTKVQTRVRSEIDARESALADALGKLRDDQAALDGTKARLAETEAWLAREADKLQAREDAIRTREERQAGVDEAAKERSEALDLREAELITAETRLNERRKAFDEAYSKLKS